MIRGRIDTKTIEKTVIGMEYGIDADGRHSYDRGHFSKKEAVEVGIEDMCRLSIFFFTRRTCRELFKQSYRMSFILESYEDCS